MVEHLSKDFWKGRYQLDSTGWDLGEISRPIKEYFDQVEDKSIRILIPGSGNGHEAEYLHQLGFKNVHVLDFASEPLTNLQNRVPSFPIKNIHCGDFFLHEGQYDIIVEQTLFCAIDPRLRQKYAENCSRLLNPEGIVVGLLFMFELDGGPPYGGSKNEYLIYFKNKFSIIKMEKCYNSIQSREGRELFIRIKK